ncbi:flagellar assembly protein FliW [Paenibacillus doosanensis]|nr:flagellar assembly protein FliW [Paenibacillus konkukensis]MCS7459950.1 flagellar assembly protein FliW [Paenibacillus doosanensis]
MLGQIGYEEEDIVTFANGIPGFEGCRQYIVIRQDAEEPIAYLQSVEEARLHFLMIDPFYVCKKYEFKLEEADLAELEIGSEEQVQVWSIVTAHEDVQETTLNLLAPIIINQYTRKGKQIILHSSPYRTKHKLSEMMAAVGGSGGA